MEIEIGIKIKKPLTKETSEFYTQCAKWCNANNAHIEDKGAYYEIVANIPYVPTIAEQVEQLEAQIEAVNKKMLRDMIIISDPNATDDEKAEAQQYFGNKAAQRNNLIEQVNALKNELRNEQN